MEYKKSLEYWQKNAEEDYSTTPISVLRYITEMEQTLNIQNVSDRKCPNCETIDIKVDEDLIWCYKCEEAYDF